jgi:hypothetical protein
MQCPSCKSARVHRSRRNGLLEFVISRTFVHPFRCEECDLRFFRLAVRAQSAQFHAIITPAATKGPNGPK